MPADEPRIVVRSDDAPKTLPISEELQKFLLAAGVSISLKYYDSSCECFSKWKSQELKGFSSLIDKIAQLGVSQLKSGTKYCDMHAGPSKLKRFQRPDDISPDIPLYELKVTEKARVHGFFVESIFFLLWLDREHACFKLD